MHPSQKISKSILASAIVTALGIPAVQADPALVQYYDWTGVFTMLNPVGDPLTNSNSSFKSGLQTRISGTMVFNAGPDTETVSYDLNGTGASSLTLGPGAGAAFVNPFGFFGGGNAVAHDISMQAIGDGGGGPGYLVSGDMLFDWNNNNNIITEIVLNAGGFFTSTTNTSTGIVTQGTGAVANFFEPLIPCTGEDSNGACTASVSLNKGAVLMATVDGNPFVNEMVDPDGTATNLGPINRHSDGVSGIAMDNGPFPGFSANFDIWNMTLTGYEPKPSEVPVPAAVWLFGSGLLGLAGVARRRKGS